MRVLCISDIHGKMRTLEKFIERAPSADLLLVAGDLTNYGDYTQAVAVIEKLESLGIKILGVPGNCDTEEVIRAMEDKKISVHGKKVSYVDLSIVGFGGSPPTPFNTPLEYSEREIEEALKRLEKGDVLLTHAPPKNTPLDKVFVGIHAGSFSVRKAIESREPLFAVCGHIHEARGVHLLKKTTVVNPGPLFKNYYAVVDVSDSVSVKLLKL
ncbi:MAG: YfcE family phosphodiesterase [Thermoprotei archaeon]|nr:MAG: YfcE family phosphodiesterase [Thermoprotei archaeon]